MVVPECSVPIFLVGAIIVCGRPTSGVHLHRWNIFGWLFPDLSDRGDKSDGLSSHRQHLRREAHGAPQTSTDLAEGGRRLRPNHVDMEVLSQGHNIPACMAVEALPE